MQRPNRLGVGSPLCPTPMGVCCTRMCVQEGKYILEKANILKVNTFAVHSRDCCQLYADTCSGGCWCVVIAQAGLQRLRVEQCGSQGHLLLDMQALYSTLNMRVGLCKRPNRALCGCCGVHLQDGQW